MDALCPQSNLEREAGLERPDREIGAVVLSCRELGSTNRTLLDLADRGAGHGTVLLADHQTAGEGKGDRVWFSRPGGGLCVSILLRSEIRSELLPQIPVVAAVAMLAALHAQGFVEARLKWPNDILIDGRKVCGILAETAEGPGRPVVVGAGLNVDLGLGDFPADLRRTATSLAIAAGRPWDRRKVLAAYLAAFETWFARWRKRGFAPVHTFWCRWSCTLGRTVSFDAADITVAGEAVGLAADGGLLVRDGSGLLHRFHSGEMRQSPPEALPHLNQSHKRSI